MYVFPVLPRGHLFTKYYFGVERKNSIDVNKEKKTPIK